MATVTKWMQTYQELPVADINSVREKLPRPIWHDLTDGDISEVLLKNKVPLIVKQGDVYKVNTKELYEQYKAKGKRVELVGR